MLRFLLWLGGVILILCVAAGLYFYQPDIPKEEIDARYANEHSRFLTLSNGDRIHYRDQGLRSGTAVVLLHGAMASLHTWEPWVRQLENQYRVITIDLPGHGLTGAVKSGDYSAPAFSEAVSGVVQSLGVSLFVLGGNSMGGGVTWRYALEYPDRVSKMILVNSVAPWGVRRSRTQDSNSPFAPLGWPWFRTFAGSINPRILVARGLRLAYNDSPVVDDQLIDRYNDLILREGTRASILGRASTARSGERQQVDLSVLTQPTLIMWGEQDGVISVDVGKRLAEVLPDAALVIYPDLGHVPMEEDPARTIKDVERFLASERL